VWSSLSKQDSRATKTDDAQARLDVGERLDIWASRLNRVVRDDKDWEIVLEREDRTEVTWKKTESIISRLGFSTFLRLRSIRADGAAIAVVRVGRLCSFRGSPSSNRDEH
jgi:hypothetical protein